LQHQLVIQNAVRNFEEQQQQDTKPIFHHQQHQQQQQQKAQGQRINEKMLDNQKLLLESLSNLPPNLLQSWIQTGQLQVTVDDGKLAAELLSRVHQATKVVCFIPDGMQSINIPFAIQKENATQEIVTKKIPIKLLTGKIKTEAE